MKDGERYQLWSYASCQGCRKWYRRLGEAEYHVTREARPGIPGPDGWEQGWASHERWIGEWERSDHAGSSFQVWTRGHDAERECPKCSTEGEPLALDLDDDDAAPEPQTEEEVLAQIVPAGFVEALDTRAGTADVVEQLKAAGVTRPKGSRWNWNRLANLATSRALDLKYGPVTAPKPPRSAAATTDPATLDTRDPWRSEFEQVPDTTGQLALYFGDTLEDRAVTLDDVEHQARANADRVEREATTQGGTK